MKYKDVMYAWSPDDLMFRGRKTIGEIKVGPHPDKTGWSDAFSYSAGSCFLETKKLKGPALIARIFIDFNTLVVRDKIDPEKAHAEFLKIDEYRKFISIDTPGAEE